VISVDRCDCTSESMYIVHVSDVHVVLYCMQSTLYMYLTCVVLCCVQSVLHDISSHQRLVDSVVEKAQGVLQSTSNSDVASFITTISSRYEKLTSDAKVSAHLHLGILISCVRSNEPCAVKAGPCSL
jgi:hypothetical protein